MNVAATSETYWRLRCRSGNRDCSKEAWLRDEIGLWYGAWSAADWYANPGASPNQRWHYLSNLPSQLALGWAPVTLPKACFDTARRFDEIPEDHWVVVCFDDALHLGRVTGPMQSSPQHPLNDSSGEVFKFRRVHSKKQFGLSQLPDVYRLIPSAGRANVHQFWSTNWELVKLLAENNSAAAVTAAIRAQPLDQWLDWMGPVAWESFCLAYLILRDGFVPTGLSVGKTLPIFDMIGQSKAGDRIFAQCKKDPNPVECDPDFLLAVGNFQGGMRAYFFAYGGCTNAPVGVVVVDRTIVLEWLNNDPEGIRYRDVMRG